MTQVGVMRLRPFERDDVVYAGHGNVETLGISLVFALLPTRRTGDNVPTHQVMTKNPAGKPVNVGAMWERKSRDDGNIFYTLTIDDPSFDKPLHLTAFQTPASDAFDLTWRRPRKRAEGAPADAGGAVDDDEIPF